MRWIATLVVAGLLQGSSWACMHLPKTYQGSHAQTAQEALIFWSQGRQELVIKVDYRIKPRAGEGMPPYLAWVIPLPSVPESYREESSALFSDMFRAWQQHMPRENSKARPLSDAVQGGIKLLKRVTVGAYTIQPIKASGTAGAKALNKWLVDNGFGGVSASATRYYVKRGWVWLAIKATLPDQKGESTDPFKGKRLRFDGDRGRGKGGSVRPLRISFASKSIVYPLKFSGHQGVFDVNLYVVTEKVLDFSGANSLGRYRFVAHSIPRFELPASVQAVHRKAKREGRFKGLKRFVVTRITGTSVNDRRNRLEDWAEDFRIQP